MIRPRLLVTLFLAPFLAGGPAGAEDDGCPHDLSHVKPRLATPWKELESFIGEEALRRTFTRPIDEMIEHGGGIGKSLEAGRRYVAEYEEILANEAKVRAEYRARGQPDEWIDIYILSTLDGVTINQAFVDAVECRRRLQESNSAGSED